jgi:rhodanese-related sulfurtransferase
MVSMLATAVAASQAPPEQRIDIDELKAAIDGGATMLLIDVREDYEVESGSMPGSIHIPLGQLEGRMSDIPKDVRLVFF